MCKDAINARHTFLQAAHVPHVSMPAGAKHAGPPFIPRTLGRKSRHRRTTVHPANTRHIYFGRIDDMLCDMLASG